MTIHINIPTSICARFRRRVIGIRAGEIVYDGPTKV